MKATNTTKPVTGRAIRRIFPVTANLKTPDVNIKVVETLRLRFFCISREPRTSRSHVTRALPSGLRFEVHVCTARPRSRGEWIYRRVFCTLKRHNPKFEKKYDFLKLFCLLTIELYFLKCNFEDNFSVNIEVSGWMKTNKPAASYHLRILSPKYGQTRNGKPLIANRSFSFVVKWPNLDLKVSCISFLTLL